MPRLTKEELKRRLQEAEASEKTTGDGIFSSPSDGVTVTETETGTVINTGKKTPDVAKANEVIAEHREKKERKKRVPKADLAQMQEDKAKAEKFAQGFGNVIVTVTEALIARMPTPEPLTEVEKDQWKICCEEMIAKYLSLIGEWQAEAGFLVMAVVIFAPRLQKPKPPKQPLRVITPEEVAAIPK
jgi:hypothetical protein